MSKKIYIGVENEGKKIKKNYIGINNVAKHIKKIYIGVDDKAQLCWSNKLNITITLDDCITSVNYSVKEVDGTEWSGTATTETIIQVGYGAYIEFSPDIKDRDDEFTYFAQSYTREIEKATDDVVLEYTGYKRCEVIFVDWQGNTLKGPAYVTPNVYYTAEPPASPTRDGYLFTGWDPEPKNLWVDKHCTIKPVYYQPKLTILWPDNGFRPYHINYKINNGVSNSKNGTISNGVVKFIFSVPYDATVEIISIEDKALTHTDGVKRTLKNVTEDTTIDIR